MDGTKFNSQYLAGLNGMTYLGDADRSLLGQIDVDAAVLGKWEAVGAVHEDPEARDHIHGSKRHLLVQM